jgi:hypothetical protein
MPNTHVRAAAPGLSIETFSNLMILNRRTSRGTPARDALDDLDFALMHARRFNAKIEGALADLASGTAPGADAPDAAGPKVTGFPVDEILRRFDELNSIAEALLVRVRAEVAS